MAIDIHAEQIIPLAQAVHHIPHRPSYGSIKRYVRIGALDSFRSGGRRHTSVEACHRFLESCNPAGAIITG